MTDKTIRRQSVSRRTLLSGLAANDITTLRQARGPMDNTQGG